MKKWNRHMAVLLCTALISQTALKIFTKPMIGDGVKRIEGMRFHLRVHALCILAIFLGTVLSFFVNESTK